MESFSGSFAERVHWLELIRFETQRRFAIPHHHIHKRKKKKKNTTEYTFIFTRVLGFANDTVKKETMKLSLLTHTQTLTLSTSLSISRCMYFIHSKWYYIREIRTRTLKYMRTYKQLRGMKNNNSIRIMYVEEKLYVHSGYRFLYEIQHKHIHPTKKNGAEHMAHRVLDHDSIDIFIHSTCLLLFAATAHPIHPFFGGKSQLYPYFTNNHLDLTLSTKK